MRHSSSSKQWLKTAQSDLAYARLSLPEGGLYEQPCFHAQQTAEKSLKAILLHYKISFPLTHNLQMLLDLLPQDLEHSECIKDVVELNAYAVLTRYPGESEPVTKKDYTRALSIAESVFEWAQKVIDSK